MIDWICSKHFIHDSWLWSSVPTNFDQDCSKIGGSPVKYHKLALYLWSRVWYHNGTSKVWNGSVDQTLDGKTFKRFQLHHKVTCLVTLPVKPYKLQELETQFGILQFELLYHLYSGASKNLRRTSKISGLLVRLSSKNEYQILFLLTVPAHIAIPPSRTDREKQPRVELWFHCRLEHRSALGILQAPLPRR